MFLWGYLKCIDIPVPNFVNLFKEYNSGFDLSGSNFEIALQYVLYYLHLALSLSALLLPVGRDD